MSIAADLIREALERAKGRAQVEPVKPPDPKRWVYCQAQDARRESCWRAPVIQGRICAECWRRMKQRGR